MEVMSDTTIMRHGVKKRYDGLSDMQYKLLNSESKISIVSAPTGSGKTYAITKAMERGEWIIFVVPTKILGQLLYEDVYEDINKQHGELHAKNRVFLFNSDQTFKENENKTLIRWDVITHPQKILGGGIIFTTPETLSSLLMNPQRYLNNGTIETIIRRFDRIVFDEAHIIEPRGFGLLNSLCRLCTMDEYRKHSAKIQILSATPVNFIDILMSFNVARTDIELIKETIITTDEDNKDIRILHGDVNIKVIKTDIKDIVLDKWNYINNNEGKSVIIYDSKKALNHDKSDYEKMPTKHRIWYNDSINSQINKYERYDRIETQKIIIGTSCLDMGINLPQLTFQIINFGFSPLQFMQRIGRVARGDYKGEIIVTVSNEELTRSPWKRKMIDFLALNKKIDIESLIKSSSDLSKNIIGKHIQNNNFNDKDDYEESYGMSFYGKMSKKAIFCAAIYWYNLKEKIQYVLKSVPAADRIRTLKNMEELDGKIDKLISILINKVRKNKKCEDFLNTFLSSSLTLRNFDSNVVLILNNNKQITLGYNWASKYTYAFDYPIINVDDNGVPHIYINDEFSSILRNKGNEGKNSSKQIFMPDGYRISLENNYDLLKNYNQALSHMKIRDSRSKESIEAGRKLIEMTGIIPFQEIRNVHEINETKSDIL